MEGEFDKEYSFHRFVGKDGRRLPNAAREGQGLRLLPPPKKMTFAEPSKDGLFSLSNLFFPQGLPIGKALGITQNQSVVFMRDLGSKKSFLAF